MIVFFLIKIIIQWQQSGRSGRRNTDSVSLVITDQSPLDQYYTVKNQKKLYALSTDKIFL
jgi:ATP-dependent helicase YprA (DUF1998 family)